MNYIQDNDDIQTQSPLRKVKHFLFPNQKIRNENNNVTKLLDKQNVPSYALPAIINGDFNEKELVEPLIRYLSTPYLRNKA